MSERFVAEIPVRMSPVSERAALARIRTVQRVSNNILAMYLGRAAQYRRDKDFRRLLAERVQAMADGDLTPNTKSQHERAKKRLAKPVPQEVVSRKFHFADKSERGAAWSNLRQRHGLIGAMPIAKLTDEGRVWYARDREMGKALTASLRDLGEFGLGADVVHHEIIPSVRDRVLAWLFGKTGKPRLASRRFPLTSVDGSSTSKNNGSLRVDLEEGTFSWAAGLGLHVITGKLLVNDDDPWLRKALRRKICVVRLLHRSLRGRRVWYVQLVLEGLSPLNPALRDAQVPGVVGVDLGTQHYAAVVRESESVRSAWIAPIAPTAHRREMARDDSISDKRPGDHRKKDRYLRRIKRKIGQKIARNPANAHAVRMVKRKLAHTKDGKAVGKVVEVPAGFRKGARVVRSKSVIDLDNRVAEIMRADASARDTDIGRAVNRLLISGNTVALEDLAYRAWQQQFGRSIGRNSPGAFVARLRRRAPIFDSRSVVDLTPLERLSQVCHMCGALSPYLPELSKPIADRTSRCAHCDRESVHLDLYSAFLAASCSEGTSVDPRIAKAMWAGAVSHLVSARQTYDRAVRLASANRPVSAVRPSRQSPPSSSSASAPRRLRSDPRAPRDDGDLGERPSDGPSVQGRSNQEGRAVPPCSSDLKGFDDTRAGPDDTLIE